MTSISLSAYKKAKLIELIFTRSLRLICSIENQNDTEFKKTIEDINNGIESIINDDSSYYGNRHRYFDNPLLDALFDHYDTTTLQEFFEEHEINLLPNAKDLKEGSLAYRLMTFIYMLDKKSSNGVEPQEDNDGSLGISNYKPITDKNEFIRKVNDFKCKMIENYFKRDDYYSIKFIDELGLFSEYFLIKSMKNKPILVGKYKDKDDKIKTSLFNLRICMDTTAIDEYFISTDNYNKLVNFITDNDIPNSFKMSAISYDDEESSATVVIPESFEEELKAQDEVEENSNSNLSDVFSILKNSPNIYNDEAALDAISAIADIISNTAAEASKVIDGIKEE